MPSRPHVEPKRIIVTGSPARCADPVNVLGRFVSNVPIVTP